MKNVEETISISTLLGFLGKEEPQAIELNHMFIGDQTVKVVRSEVSDFPCFTVMYPGLVEVEFVMDPSQTEVLRLTVRQSAMTLAELEECSEVLPSLTISCLAVEPGERERLNALAQRYVALGRMNSRERAEQLMMHYAARVLFCPKKYGGLRHV